jgi:hypothetical protein
VLAKNVNDNACILDKRGAYEFFASKLAPTKTLTDWHYPPGRLFQTATESYSFGPAALIASLTSNFLKFSTNRPASAFAASS